MPANDLKHYLVREADARRLADNAASTAVRDIHLETALQYARLAQAARREISGLPRSS